MNWITKRTSCIAKSMIALLALAVILPATAEDKEDPYLKADETWISISGTAVKPTDDSFVLDYGDGHVIVEMDDWDSYGDAFGIADGYKVTVYGEVDDDLFEKTSIEASSVYVENLGTYFYANSADEEYDDDYDYWLIGGRIAVGQMTLRGTVTNIEGREFTIDTGKRQISVDTVEMTHNPLDDFGWPAVDKGDYVSVTGEMDYNTWDERELSADTITVLLQD